MTGPECGEWQGVLAMHAVGSVSDQDSAELQEHLDRCPECRQDAVDVQTAAVALMSLGPAQVARIERRTAGPARPRPVLGRRERLDPGPGATPPVAPSRAAPHVAPGTGLRRAVGRRRRAAGAVGAGAVLLVAAAALVAVVTLGGPHGSRPVRVVALTGQEGVRATVSLTSQSWGTGATLRESGQAPGQVLTVSMRTSSGRWWVAGSYRTVSRAGSLVVQLSCAVPADQITDVWVSDQGGHTVLNGYVG
ncbi:MAG TPA: zf-HC2 domain-containing protein [Acidimicrobiales bacterium]|nr:zf-HC2 domain-containing protein [Acidimicrobiales bacterium]